MWTKNKPVKFAYVRFIFLVRNKRTFLYFTDRRSNLAEILIFLYRSFQKMNNSKVQWTSKPQAFVTCKKDFTYFSTLHFLCFEIIAELFATFESIHSHWKYAEVSYLHRSLFFLFSKNHYRINAFLKLIYIQQFL